MIKYSTYMREAFRKEMLLFYFSRKENELWTK